MIVRMIAGGTEIQAIERAISTAPRKNDIQVVADELPAQAKSSRVKMALLALFDVGRTNMRS
jgi:hypothetical protein